MLCGDLLGLCVVGGHNNMSYDGRGDNMDAPANRCSLLTRVNEKSKPHVIVMSTFAPRRFESRTMLGLELIIHFMLPL